MIRLESLIAMHLCVMLALLPKEVKLSKAAVKYRMRLGVVKRGKMLEAWALRDRGRMRRGIQKYTRYIIQPAWTTTDLEGMLQI